MCSKFDHTQCGRTCACAVACFYPHSTVSNVVASVTIHDNTNKSIYIHKYISKRCSFERCKKCLKTATRSKKMKLLWKVTNLHIYSFKHTFNINTHACPCTHKYISKHKNKHTSKIIYTNKDIYTYAYTCTYIYTHTYTCTCTCTLACACLCVLLFVVFFFCLS